jgi:hypothetical protein
VISLKTSLFLNTQSNLPVIISGISVFIAFLSVTLTVIISLWNVNRQKNAALKNDEEKFMRELNLKTCDEFLEMIFEVRNLFQSTRSLESQLEWTIKGHKKIEEFNDYLWKVIEDKSIQEFWMYFLKREIVLQNYKADVEKIYHDWDNASQSIWKFKTFWIPGRTDQELIQELKKVNVVIEPIIELTTTLQRKVQSDFLGKIYGRIIT